MIVKIIPLKKLPRGLDLFDYQVPTELEKIIRVGQLVDIPLRKSIIFGIIFSVHTETSETLKPIAGVAFEIPLVSQSSINVWKVMSEWYGVSLGSLARMFLPPLQKNKLKKISSNPIPSLNENHRLGPGHAGGREKIIPLIHIYRSQTEHQKIIEETINGTTLILVPEVGLIKEVEELLNADARAVSCVWHAQLSIKEQFLIWWQIRNGEKNIIIGTRSALFLPFPQLDTIIIDYEHDINLKNSDQSPRYHVKDVTELLAGAYGPTINLASFSPSVKSYFEIHKNLATLKTKPDWVENHIANIKIIDMLDERRAGRYEIFADETKKAILDAKKNIFILVERLGFATSIGCNDCGRMEACSRCDTPLVYHEDNTMQCHYCHTIAKKPEACPNCRSQLTILRGAGTETVEAHTRKIMQKNPSHAIYRIDSEQEDSYISSVPKHINTPIIIIGTPMAIKYVNWKETDLVILPDPDKRLAWPEFSAGENCWQLLSEILFRRHKTSTVYLQTRHPTGSFYKSISEPDRFYRLDLNARRRLNYPPYSFLVRYMFGDESKISGVREANNLVKTLQNNLTNERKNIIIRGPIETAPPYYRGQHWQVITAQLHKDTWQEDLIWLNARIPANWKIDPNPNTLLTP